MVDFERVIARRPSLFRDDLDNSAEDLLNLIRQSRFLIIGGAGSIGQAVVKQVLLRDPLTLDVIDLSENNLAELVRDIRSSHEKINTQLRTFALDINSPEFDEFIRANKNYDYILNLAALKHVRSEKDPFTLMRLLRVNTLHARKLLKISEDSKVRKYFSVSSDKASSPINMMGASKRIMEMMLYRHRHSVPVSTARFANVAFSDGSLLHSFTLRFVKRQPIAAPRDIKRYFISHQEAGELCLLSCILGESADIFFPKQLQEKSLISLSEVAVKYIEAQGFQAKLYENDEEAKASVDTDVKGGFWPYVLSTSDTTGEKLWEEFYHSGETVALERFKSIGVVKGFPNYSESRLDNYEQTLTRLISSGHWKKQHLVDLVTETVPEFHHTEMGKSLDEKM